MAKPARSSRSPAARVGARLRDRRRALNLTLDDVAGRTGLTKGFISDVERDRTSPSVASLLGICEAVGLSVGSLFESAGTAIVRKADRKRIRFGGTRIEDFLLSSSTRSRIQVVMSHMAPGGTGGEEPYRLPAEEEFVLVLHGSLRMTVNGAVTVLKEGDAMTFDPRLPHTFANASDKKPARVLFAFTPPPY